MGDSATAGSRLSGKIAIVTGGASGIGLGIVERFVEEGAKVVVADLVLDGKPIPAGDSVISEQLDVRDRDGWARVVEKCRAHFGAPNVLVCNAGTMMASSLLETDGSEYRTSFEINVLGAVFGIQAAAPGMKESGSGSIIVVSSTASEIGTSGVAPYGASKAANKSLAKSAAIELAPLGIRVNSLHPGGVDTPMHAAMMGADFDQEAFYGHLPIPRVAKPEEIAGAAAFLASDDSSFVTGSAYFVDGGQLAGPAI
ncbi:SDR family NAD(P)-dependent oxidoreductase [Rhodococcus sp. 27YEA15]|uniref:SDR family NAD(P)-dependent oxidoreductase n=1 Tax=Rhodococcus sp. 27YEA15 TaxID=3156259 RepID=UPI003C79C123